MTVSGKTKRRSSRAGGQSLIECLLIVAGITFFALLGFSALNNGIGAQSSAMADALAGNSSSAEFSFGDTNDAAGAPLLDFDSELLATKPPIGAARAEGISAFNQGVVAGLIDTLLEDLSALLNPVDTALAIAELGRLLATDLVATVKLLYEELIASQIDTLVNGSDYNRGFVLGNQVSAIKAVSVLGKASSAAVLVGAAKKAEGGATGNRIVFRSLAKGEDPTQGLTARNPLAKTTPAQHVNGKRDSQFISTTKDQDAATGKFNSGNGVVEIDLNKIDGGVVDVSEGVPGGSQKVNNFARKDREVLIEGRIPPEAIRVIEDPK